MADALLTVENLTKSFGDKLLFEDISFGINAGQKSALIARNGYGKSTLLNIIITATGQKGYNTLQDSGKITFRSDLKLAYLPQSPEAYPHQVVRDFVYNVQRPETEDSWTFEQRMEEIISRMKVDTLLDRPMETLSGGEQKKVALCRLLMDDCNLLILDEPTNHLDIDMIEWLEEFLSRQRLALLMVTHDRYFLDNVCQDIYELDNARLYHYKGHYDYYLEKKAEREANERAEVAKARSLYRTELEWMRRMPQARGTKAQARIDAFYELEAKAHTRFDDSRPQLTVKTERIGGKILELYNICYRDIIDDYSYVFKRGEKIGIVGPNGVGKSTFLNIITERLKPTSGRVVVGQTIQFGYYTQAGMSAPPDRRVIDLVKDIAEEIELDNGKSMSAHQFLTYFGFDGTTQFNYFGNLSGGEKRRLYLLQVLMANPNFLILDEPTNNLDIETLQVLEEYLTDFRGCLIIVSHDRWFMDRVVDHLLVFHGEGRIEDYPGNYTQYRLSDKEREQEALRAKEAQKKAEEKEAPRRSAHKRKLSYRERQEMEKLEKEIEQLEQEQADIIKALSGGEQNAEEITQLSKRLPECEKELETKSDRWLELSMIED